MGHYHRNKPRATAISVTRPASSSRSQIASSSDAWESRLMGPDGTTNGTTAASIAGFEHTFISGSATSGVYCRKI